jgi:hypothetical protein
MRPFLVQFSEAAYSDHAPSWADFIERFVARELIRQQPEAAPSGPFADHFCILVENKRAVGVELMDTGFETIMAGEVSAGTIRTPTILMYSGIGLAEQPRERGDRRRQAEEWLHRRQLPWRTYVRRAVAPPSLDYYR